MTAVVEQIVAVGAALGLGGGGLALVIQQVRVGIAKRYDAVTHRITAEADARLKDAETERLAAEAAKLRAEAEIEAARTERVEAEGDVQHTAITAEMLARYEARLGRAEERAERAERRVDECERRHREAEARHAAALAERDKRIGALERAVRRLGDTPTGMQAVDGRGDER